jgi:hypothetical protein
MCAVGGSCSSVLQLQEALEYFDPGEKTRALFGSEAREQGRFACTGERYEFTVHATAAAAQAHLPLPPIRSACGALDELAGTGACDVLAHPDVIKAAGYRPEHPKEWWDRMADAAASSGMATEVSSAGWRKPAAEQYPAEGLFARLAARGVPFTTASDAHQVSLVADRVGDLYALLSSVGVDHLTGYRRRQAHTLALTEPQPLRDGA